ncbi:MAG: group II intron reverse transcriptase/maturase [Flavobacteriaceae bacterium]
MSDSNELAWNEIDWNKIQQRISRMQRRIYNAKKKENNVLIHKLQTKLINSFDARLISVRQVTTLNKGKYTKGYDKKTYTRPKEKITLAQNLTIDGKSDYIRRVFIPKPGKNETRPLGIPTIKDRAKQNLVKLALEPEWEAIFEPGSYGFRPGRSCQDAIENIFTSTRSKPKYVLDADISKCFDQIDHNKLIEKLNTTPQISKQIKTWLQADVMINFGNRNKVELNTGAGTPQGGIISPLLANIALHGLGNYLKDQYVKSIYSNKKQGKIQRAKELGYIRYADDFVIICKDIEAVHEAKINCEIWLKGIGLKLNENKTQILSTTQGFTFLGFYIILIKRNEKYRCKIQISSQNKKQLVSKCALILNKNKASSSFILIKQLAPVIIGWGNYFKYSECSEEFQTMDHRIFGLLRSWVFRRKAQGLNRTSIKEKYFPSDRLYVYQGVTHKDNWVLTGKYKTIDGKILSNYLPKLSWIKSEKFVKVKNIASIYNGDHIYWSLRLQRYSFFGNRTKKLIRLQKGICAICKNKFIPTDIIAIDHIIPLSKKGSNRIPNLQAIHKTCHIIKTRADRSLSN